MSQELIDKAMDSHRLASVIITGKVGDAVAEAIPHLLMAADCFGRALRSQQRAEVLLELGKLYLRVNEETSAVESFEEAIRIYRDLGDKRAAANAGIAAGLAQRARARPELAKAYLERSMAILREAGDMLDVAQCQTTLASVHLDEGHHVEALSCCREALPVLVRFTKRLEIAHIHELMAVAHQMAKDHEAAAKDYELSIAMKHDQLGDIRGAAKTLSRYADMQRHRGDLDGALALYHRALSIHRLRNDQALIAQVLGNIGTIHVERNEPAKAISHYRQCLELSEQAGEKAAAAQALYNLAAVHIAQRADGDAIAALTRAAGICDELGSRALSAKVLSALADLHGKSGDAIQAQACRRRRADVLEAMGDSDGLLHCLDDLIEAATEREDWESVAELEKRALGSCRDCLTPEAMASRRERHGSLLARLGDHAEALQSLNLAIGFYDTIDRPGDSARALRALGASELQVGASADALAHFTRALEIAVQFADRRSEATALIGIGNAQVQLGAKDQAKIALDRAAEIRQELGDEHGTSVIRKATNTL